MPVNPAELNVDQQKAGTKEAQERQDAHYRELSRAIIVSKIAAGLAREKQASSQQAKLDPDSKPLLLCVTALDENSQKTDKQTLFSLQKIEESDSQFKRQPKKEEKRKKKDKTKRKKPSRRKAWTSMLKGASACLLALCMGFSTMEQPLKAQEIDQGSDQNRLSVLLEEIPGKSREQVYFSLIEVGENNELSDPLKNSGITLADGLNQDVEADGKTARALFGYLEEQEVEAERKALQLEAEDKGNASINQSDSESDQDDISNLTDTESFSSQASQLNMADLSTVSSLSAFPALPNNSALSSPSQSEADSEEAGSLENSENFESSDRIDYSMQSQEPAAAAGRFYDLGGTLPYHLEKTNEQGEAVFENLKDAIYLLVMLDQANYDQIEPLLVRLPQFDASSNSYVSDITITPKHARFTRLTLQKLDGLTHETISGQAVFSSYAPGNSEELQNNKEAALLESRGTDVNGLVSFFLQDEMSIEEVQAPEGYQKSDQKLSISVREGVILINGQEIEGNLLKFNNYRIMTPSDENPGSQDPADPDTPAGADPGSDGKGPDGSDGPSNIDGTDGGIDPEPDTEPGLQSQSPTLIGSKQPSSSSVAPNTGIFSNRMLFLGLIGAGVLLLLITGSIYYKKRRERQMGLEDLEIEEFGHSSNRPASYPFPRQPSYFEQDPQNQNDHTAQKSQMEEYRFQADQNHKDEEDDGWPQQPWNKREI